MSNWHYPSTPGVEKESFRLLALFDQRVSQDDWDEYETETEAAMAALTARADAISSRLNGIRCALIRAQSKLI